VFIYLESGKVEIPTVAVYLNSNLESVTVKDMQIYYYYSQKKLPSCIQSSTGMSERLHGLASSNPCQGKQETGQLDRSSPVKSLRWGKDSIGREVLAIDRGICCEI
jgi:hypothetical protein